VENVDERLLMRHANRCEVSIQISVKRWYEVVYRIDVA
jgi:hypothetical protein